MEIREKVANLPTQPGVYLFRDAAANVLYVGKAQSLRNRVRSYFLDKAIEDAKTGEHCPGCSGRFQNRYGLPFKKTEERCVKLTEVEAETF